MVSVDFLIMNMKFVQCCMLISICILCLPYGSFCENRQYENCKKAEFCGKQIVKFPFYIQEESYCGQPPGFNLTCLEDERLILEVSEEKYEVREIFYSNNSLRVTNCFLSSNGDSCSLSKISNLQLPSDGHFQLRSSLNLLLLSNCTSESAKKFSNFKVGCDLKKNDTDWVLVMRMTDTSITLATEACSRAMIAPVVDDHSGDADDYLELLRNGFVLKWTATNCSNCNAGNHKNLRLKLAIASGVGGCSILLLVILIICRCWMRAKYGSSMFSQDSSSYPKDVEAFIKQYGSSIPKRFRYSTLKKITNSFKDELGKGGYGNVYKGTLADGRVVAVKVLKSTKGNGEEFMNEVASIGRTSHVNVVTLLGFCYEAKRRALIYEFMPNGSLEKFTYGKTPSLEGQHLGWEKLYSIAVGIARGLEYLHRGCNTRILHFDIKPHNILLDENFRPKISDFGLAKLYSTDESIISSLLQARGTIGYIAPEVMSRNFGQVSHKSDVYSYGMMILEMVGGRKNVNAGADHTSEIYYPRWLYKRIQSDDVLNLANKISAEENEIVRKMVIVGLWCIQIYPSQRPSISKVIEMLKGQTAALEIPPHPYLCSVPSSPSNSPKKLLFCSSSGKGPTSSA